MERNILLTISFDGSYFHGFQIQNNSYTVQECFQDSLKKVLGFCPDIKACSRTDSGVHARMFCISMKIDSPITNEKLLSALNHFLPPYIIVYDIKDVSDDFHARYSCTGKEYVYEIWNSKLRNPFLYKRALHHYYDIDEHVLDEASKHYIGTHDFTSFCTKDLRKGGDLTRTVTNANVKREGDKILFTVSADGFLYNMVRIMVGTLLKVQEGKISKDSIPDILSSLDRKNAGPTAPSHGLYLNRVFYEDGF